MSDSTSKTVTKTFKKYVPPGKKTCVVRLRKNYQDCDVYIGPHVSNSSWKLNASKWSNSFYNPNDPEQSLKQYRHMILSSSDLRKALLPELANKRLGCFCDNLRNCHGRVLVDLVNQKQQQSPHKIVHFSTPKRFLNCYFFKGEKSPLSNLYQCHLEWNGQTYHSVSQILAHLDALKMKQFEVAEKIIKCKTPAKAAFFRSKLRSLSPFHPRSRIESLRLMQELIALKWDQVSEFQTLLKSKAHKYVLLEATFNRFWGCGLDIAYLEEEKNFSYFEGCNFLGWILMYVTFTKQNIPFPSVNDFFYDSEMCTLKCGFLEFLQMVEIFS